ncbi:hypothetical protein GZ77_02410 [Endozoicomonas montiporae]|uniref:YbaK/aminoacyl-tRNA synthetase-associated domain-containing protein n=3 Tax=Endozoicomonas montiporae TaxID=1027273 RepID=A0A081NAN3_9GAMM|nr:YbaK/prolyl-tRNA synthetase associated protein [Endozoicomonas montiporae CL-33]KEQ15506.1 hypothetical protein GZ77_02410 [Endozoicomonas montiporae]
MLVQKVAEFLAAHHVSYRTQQHKPAFSAQEVAEQAHISGHKVAKTVVIKLDGKMALCVLPATERVNFSMLRHAAGSHTAELATEDEFANHFPACEPGAVPPFGNLYGLPVYAMETLKAGKTLAFNSGDASELLVLEWEDFTELVRPVVLTEQQRAAIA